jgi:parvulin-like peptidyl-prolyl isomerase
LGASRPAFPLAVLLVAGVLATVSSCRRESRSADPVLLELGEQAVRRSDFERHVADIAARGGTPVTAEVRAALVDPYLDERALVLEARSRGLLPEGAGPDEERAGVERLLAAAAAGQVTVGEAELAEFCRVHLREFDTPERVTVRQIVVPTSNEARDVRRRLLREPRSFEALARTQSRAPEAATGGLMGTFARGELPKEMEAAAFDLPVGQPSGIVETPLGHHVMRVEERHPARVATEEFCRAEAGPRLKREKADRAAREFVRSVRARAKVNHEAVQAAAPAR